MFKLIPRSSVIVCTVFPRYSLLKTRRNSHEQEVTAHIASLGKQGRFEAVADFFQFNEFQLRSLPNGAIRSILLLFSYL